MADNINIYNQRRDVISTLPNELLCDIFSFLPFKEAARTTILSPRFQNIWRGMKKVDFQESYFVNQNDNEANQQIQRRVFIEFARQYKENYNGANLDGFSLTFSRPADFPQDMQDLISFSTARKAKELNLDFHDPIWREDILQTQRGVFNLPVHVYGREDLESLKLFACNFVISELKKFSALKNLSLGWIQLAPRFVKTILLQCPLLESFSLKNCWSYEGYLDISTPNFGLQTLVIDKCNYVGCLFQFDEAPNLRLFKYSGMADDFKFKRQLSTLQEAEIDFALEPGFSARGDAIYNLLQDIFSVRVLTVCSYLLQVVPTAAEPRGLKKTLNVKHLILKTSMHPFEFYGIKFMLRSCPLLETLTLDMGDVRIFPNYAPPFKLNPLEFWVKNLVIFKCMNNTLKFIEVINFKGTAYEFLFLQYLIYFGRVLEKVNLYLSKDGGNREKYLQTALGIQNGFKKENLSVSIY